MEETFSPDAPVLILGGGRVGLTAAERLEESGLRCTIVEKHAATAGGDRRFVTGVGRRIEVRSPLGGPAPLVASAAWPAA